MNERQTSSPLPSWPGISAATLLQVADSKSLREAEGCSCTQVWAKQQGLLKAGDGLHGWLLTSFLGRVAASGALVNNFCPSHLPPCCLVICICSHNGFGVMCSEKQAQMRLCNFAILSRTAS